MVRKQHVVAATIFAALLAGTSLTPSASAAEKAVDWSGFYGGVNIGYGVGRNPSGIVAGFANEKFTGQPHGVLGGLQAGYNVHRGSLLLGWEADIQFSAQKDSYTCVMTGFCVGTVGSFVTQEYPWFATLRARAGFVHGPILLYVTGGAIYGQAKALVRDTNAPGPVQFGDTRWGWTAGAGGEFLLNPNWSVKLEYLYANLGSGGGIYIPAFNRSFSTDYRNHFVRAGLNYQFGNRAGAPVQFATRGDWSGSYAGVFAGHAIARNPSRLFSDDGFGNLGNERFTLPPAGWLGGVNAGTNWQRDRWLFGVEADIHGAIQKDDNTCVLGCFPPLVSLSAKVEQKLPWLATLRARSGIVAGDVFLYATGGVAYGGIRNRLIETSVPNVVRSFEFSHSRPGWVAGAGIEAALPGANRVSVKAEYLFVDLGKTADAYSGAVDGVLHSSVRNHVFRLGINRKLGAVN